jgi:hypothetical protein
MAGALAVQIPGGSESGGRPPMGLQIEKLHGRVLRVRRASARADDGACPRRYRLPGAYDQEIKVWLGAQALRRVTLLIGSESSKRRLGPASDIRQLIYLFVSSRRHPHFGILLIHEWSRHGR